MAGRDDGQLRHAAHRAGQWRRRSGHRRRRQVLRRPARRHCRQRSRAPASRGDRGRDPPTEHAGPHLQSVRDRTGYRARRGPDRPPRRGCARAGVLRQFGHGGQRGRLQDHPPHRAHQTRCRRRRLPRTHHGFARADRPAGQAGAVRTAARRRHPRPVRRYRRVGRRRHRRHGRGVPRADHGGGRCRHTAAGLPGRRA